MPKAKPVSLFPLSFEQAIDVLINAKPNIKKERLTRGKRRSAKAAKRTQREA
jgi:hypothetical protein